MTQLFLLSCLQEEAVKALMKYGVGSCGPRGFYGTMGKFVVSSHLREKRTCFVISLLIFRHGNCQGLQIWCSAISLLRERTNLSPNSLFNFLIFSQMVCSLSQTEMAFSWRHFIGDPWWMLPLSFTILYCPFQWLLQTFMATAMLKLKIIVVFLGDILILLEFKLCIVVVTYIYICRQENEHSFFPDISTYLRLRVVR